MTPTSTTTLAQVPLLDSTSSAVTTSAFVGLESWLRNTLVCGKGRWREGGRRGLKKKSNAFPGVYTFYLTADDKAKLYIDNNLVIDSHMATGAVTGKPPCSLYFTFVFLSQTTV